MKALSIMQPWAWLIVNGHKAIENRTWRCHVRGPILIHAGKKLDEDAAESHDHWTRAIRDHVIEDLRNAAQHDAADHRRHLMAAE